LTLSDGSSNIVSIFSIAGTKHSSSSLKLSLNILFNYVFLFRIIFWGNVNDLALTSGKTRILLRNDSTVVWWISFIKGRSIIFRPSASFFRNTSQFLLDFQWVSFGLSFHISFHFLVRILQVLWEFETILLFNLTQLYIFISIISVFIVSTRNIVVDWLLCGNCSFDLILLLVCYIVAWKALQYIIFLLIAFFVWIIRIIVWVSRRKGLAWILKPRSWKRVRMVWGRNWKIYRLCSSRVKLIFLRQVSCTRYRFYLVGCACKLSWWKYILILLTSIFLG
jgi:hypothetical protein